MLIDSEDIIEFHRSRWPIRFARNIYQAACLGREYKRGYSAATYDADHDDDRYDIDQDEGCLFGARCCCPHIYHSSSECFTAEWAEEYDRESVEGAP